MDHIITVSTPKVMPPKPTVKEELTLEAALAQPFRFPRIGKMYETRIGAEMKKSVPKEFRPRKHKKKSKQSGRIDHEMRRKVLSKLTTWKISKEIREYPDVEITPDQLRHLLLRMVKTSKIERRMRREGNHWSYEYRVKKRKGPSERQKRINDERDLKIAETCTDWMTTTDIAHVLTLSPSTVKQAMPRVIKKGLVERKGVHHLTRYKTKLT